MKDNRSCIRSAALCLAALLTIAACSPKDDQAPVQTDSASTPATTTADTPTSTVPADRTAYTVIEDEQILAEFAEGRVYKLLRYPEFTENTATDAAINRALARAAEHEYNTHALNVQEMIDEKQPYHYEVTQVEVLRCDETLLSVFCVAEYTTTGTAAQKFTYSCHLNPADGSEYSVRDLVADYDRLGALLREGKGEQVWGDETLMQETTWDDLLVQIKTNYEIYPTVCFDEQGVIVCFELPELLKWNAGFRISYADAGEALTIGAPAGEGN